MVCKSIIDDKKNRSNPGSLQAFDGPTQNGLSKQIEHGGGRAEKGGHRPWEIFPCERLQVYIIADKFA
jgi:hypothetical protein